MITTELRIASFGIRVGSRVIGAARLTNAGGCMYIYVCMCVCTRSVLKGKQEAVPCRTGYRWSAPLSVHGSAAQTFVQDGGGKAKARVAMRYR